MKILFLSLIHFTSLQEKNIYTDLLREFQNNGHEIYCIAPIERQNDKSTKLIKEGTSHILELRIGKTQKTNIVEKGISTLLIEPLLLKGIKKYFSDVKFDLVLYSTPPITFYKAVQYVKKRDRAVSYLLLKDIFPQNAVDLGMLKKAGVSSFIYHFFREKEKRLYKVSDFIGCMSDANVKYLMEHNKDLKNVHVLPNSIQAKSINHVDFDKEHIRCKYKIPLDKKVLIYGGNLGKPQGINFLIECVENLKDNKKVFFVICGKGTEYSTIKSAVTKHDNVLLINGLPEKDYDSLVRACDIGLIFLDKKFTIPNFPSRILSYMDNELPVLAVTDAVSDIGEKILQGNFGKWCMHGDIEDFKHNLNELLAEDLPLKGKNAKRYLITHYITEISYKIIINNIGEKNV